MSGAAMTALAVTAAVGTGYSIYASEQAASERKDAMRKAEAQAEAAKKSADEQYNAAHQKNPDIAGADAASRLYANQGAASTILTGKDKKGGGTLGAGPGTGGSAAAPTSAGGMPKSTLLG